MTPLMDALWAHAHFEYPFTAEAVNMLLEHGAEVDAGVLSVLDEAPPDVRQMLQDRDNAMQPK